MALLQQGDDFIRHAIVQRVEDVGGRGLVAIELVGDVRFAVHRTAGGQWHDLALKREPDRIVHAESHPADVLKEELAATRRAFVMRQDINHLPFREDINKKRLSAQRSHRVKRPAHFAERPLDGGDFGDMTQMAGHAKILGVGKIRLREELLKHLPGTALVGHNDALPRLATDGDYLHA